MPIVRMLGHVAVLFLVFKGIHTVLHNDSIKLHSYQQLQEDSFFSLPSPAFIFYRVFYDGHSGWCEMIPHCNFDLYFSNNEQCWIYFHVFADHLYAFFGEKSV